MAACSETPRVVALLSWWDEKPEWLARTVTSVAPFCVGIVAADGCYALNPFATENSHPEEVDAIKQAASQAGLPLTLKQRGGLWGGGQVEKRTHMFNLAQRVSPAPDWLFVINADEHVDHHDGVLTTLAATQHDVGEVQGLPDTMGRRLFRAKVKPRCECAVSYVAGNGRQLTARQYATPKAFARLVPAVQLDLTLASNGDRSSASRDGRSQAAYLAELFNLYPAGIEPASTRPQGMFARCEWSPDTRYQGGGRCNREGCNGGPRYTTCPLAQDEIERVARG